jgi:hypothetical protein
LNIDYDKILQKNITNLIKLEKKKQEYIKNNLLDRMEKINDIIEIEEDRLYKLLGK